MSEPITDPAALLREGVEWVELQEQLPPDERNWDQGAWRRHRPHVCGTSGCLFGHIAENAGGVWASNNPASTHYDDLVPLPGEKIDFENLDEEWLNTQGEGFVSVFSRVRHLLDLNYEQASDLAHAAATAKVIRERAERIATVRGWDLRRTTDGGAAQTDETAEVIATS